MFASPMGTGETRYMTYRCRTPHLRRRLDLVDEPVGMAVVARLSQPDAAQLFAPDVDLDQLHRLCASGHAGAPDVAEVWDRLPLPRRRAVVDLLVTGSSPGAWCLTADA